MTSIAINPEVVGLDDRPQVFEDSPLTDFEEKELVIVKTAIATAYADKLERNLAIGAGLHKIFTRKLYRGKNGGRRWEEWLADESKELTNAEPLNTKTAQRLRAFYRFRVEILPRRPEQASDEKLPLPTNHYQVDALLGQLDKHPHAAIEIWKAACAQAGRGKVPTSDQVNRAATAYKANAENEAHRLSNKQQARNYKAVQSSRSASVPSAGRSAPEPTPVDFSPELPSNRIPAWELEAHDDSVDAGAECKRITQALNDAFKALATLRGILYSQTNKYGSDYLGFLRQVDAGVYSLRNIDGQVGQMAEDVAFINQLLSADVGEGELAQSTVDVKAIPTR